MMDKPCVPQPAAVSKIDRLYTSLPLAICKAPPIAHRGGKDARGFAPFDIAVMSAVLWHAWDAHAQANHQRSYRVAGETIKEERRRYQQQHPEAWRDVKEQRRRGEHAPAPMLMHTWGVAEHQPMPIAEAAPLAGQRGYNKDKGEHRGDPPPDVIEVTVSQRGLLAVAGLSKSAAQTAKLLGALDRLQRPLDGDAYPRTPLLRQWHKTEHGLHLLVSGEWLEPSYRQVPLPLPVRGATIQALYLWTFAIQPWSPRQRHKAIYFHKLCQRLGMPLRGSFIARRGIDRAVDGVNEHLYRLDLRALSRAGVKAPEKIDIINAGPGRVRLKAELPNWDAEDNVDNDDPAAAYKPKTKVRAKPKTKPVVVRRRLGGSIGQATVSGDLRGIINVDNAGHMAAAVTEAPPRIERKRLQAKPAAVSPILQEIREAYASFSAEQEVWEQGKLVAVQQAWRELAANPTAEAKRDFQQFLDRNGIDRAMLQRAIAEAAGAQ